MYPTNKIIYNLRHISMTKMQIINRQNDLTMNYEYMHRTLNCQMILTCQKLLKLICQNFMYFDNIINFTRFAGTLFDTNINQDR